MRRESATALVVMIAALALGSARAADAPEAADGAAAARPLAWLKSGDYASLERFYSQQQHAYESGQISDQALYGSFRRLYQDSPDNRRRFNQWVQSFPHSYAATLARGTFLYRMAWAERGELTIDQTSSGQLEAMRSYLRQARPDLEASLKMTAKPYLSTLYLLNVAILEGSAQETRHWFEAGTALDAGNSLVRLRYMFSLRPRWGGSYEQMQDFLEQCQAQHLDPKLLARLEMPIHADKAEDAMRSGNRAATLSEWEQVLKLAQSAQEPPSSEALLGYTRAAVDLNRRADVDRGLTLLAGRKLDEPWTLAQAGWLFSVNHREAEGWPLLLRAAELNDSWAQFTVGEGFYSGVPAAQLKSDRTAGLNWIRLSARQCFPQARQFLAAHGEPAVPCERAAGGLDSLGLPLSFAQSVQRAIWGVLVAVILGWLAVSRTRTLDADERALRHPVGILIVGIVGFAFFAALTILSNLYANSTSTPLTTLVFVGFALLSLLLVAEYRFVRHDLTAEGIQYGRLNGSRGLLRWNQVAHVSYSPFMKWFRLETSAGEVVRISALLTGLPAFARAVLDHVPRQVIRGEACERLQSTAAGELPRVFG